MAALLTGATTPAPMASGQRPSNPLDSDTCGRMAEAMRLAPKDPFVGATLGSYEVEKLLGEGGMSVVYLARHTLMDRKVAIKLLRPELSRSQPLIQRFFHEARATAGIQHQGIVQVFDFGYHTDGRAYYVMEFLNGRNLGRLMQREERISMALAFDLVRQIASVMAAAHRQGIVHRDLKPENIMLVSDAAVPHELRVKVVDFGIAKLRSESLVGGLGTQVGMLLGTPLYMSPEQCLDAKSVDGRADIYSLGCILFEMLCGRPPFAQTSPGALIQAHIDQTPPRPSTLIEDLPPPVERLLLRCLAKQPDQRPQTMEAFIAELNGERVDGSAPKPTPKAIAYEIERLSAPRARSKRYKSWRQGARLRGAGRWVLPFSLTLIAGGGAIVGVLKAGAPSETIVDPSPLEIDRAGTAMPQAPVETNAPAGAAPEPSGSTVTERQANVPALVQPTTPEPTSAQPALMQPTPVQPASNQIQKDARPQPDIAIAPSSGHSKEAPTTRPQRREKAAAVVRPDVAAGRGRNIVTPITDAPTKKTPTYHLGPEQTGPLPNK